MILSYKTYNRVQEDKFPHIYLFLGALAITLLNIQFSSKLYKATFNQY